MALSYWAADRSRPILDLTAGEALRVAASKAPDRIALVEVMPHGMGSLVGADATHRRWTKSEILAEAENCAPWLLQS